MRLAVYTDYTYRRDADGVSGERAFVTFMGGLEPLVDELVLVGRLAPEPGRSHYPLAPTVGFLGLPFYADLTRPGAVLGSLWESARRFWRLLDDVDTVWLLGPYVHAILFAVVALLRRRRVALGVRQDFPRYVRSRRPGKRWMHLAADAMEGAFRLLARRLPMVVVGPDLARNYRRSRRLLPIAVSLVSEDAVVAPERALERPVGHPWRILSVGRIDAEKNPLLLADILAALNADEERARLTVVGDGPMLGALEERLRELGCDGAADVRGYVPIDGGLLELYREADLVLHVSLTEGVPQVLFEAFGAGTPVVATEVGGVGQAVGDAGLLIPARDADAAVAAVRRVLEEPGVRERLVRAGHARVRGHTMEHELRRLTAFLAG